MSLLTQEYQKARNQDIANRYIKGETQRSIGQHYGMSRQAVSQILKRLNTPTRVKRGERARLTNIVEYSGSDLAGQNIKELVELVEYYKAKFRSECIRNANMKRYYKEKLLSKLLEA